MGESVRWASTHRRLALLASIVASGALLLGAFVGTAAASKKKKPTPVKTTVAITSTSATKFTGTVSSPKPACEKGRRVTLYRQTSARLLGADGPDYPGFSAQGTTKTDPTGNWEADAANGFSEFLEGTYRPYVAPMAVTFGGRRYMCQPSWGPSTFA